MKEFFKFIKHLTSKSPSTSNWSFWVSLALVFKISFFVLKICIEDNPKINPNYPETFAIEGGDTYSYIDPIEGLIKTGNYEGTISDDYRMPGYGLPYYLFRQIFDLTWSLNCVVILQLLFSTISVYLLANIALLIFLKQRYFYITFILYTISTYVSIYDHILLTESFCTSSLIISVYYLITARESTIRIIIAGLFLSWCIFLRPVITPLFLIFILYILFNITQNFNGIIHKCKKCIFLLLPFFILDGIWVARNYMKYNRFIPLTKTIYCTGIDESYWGSLFQFMNSFGGSIVFWEPGADITFFITPIENTKSVKISTLPNYIYTSKFNLDSLKSVRDLIQKVENQKTDNKTKEIYTKEIKNKLAIYTQSIKVEHPFHYYISSRFIVLKTFFFHSGTYNLFYKPSFELNRTYWLTKVFYSVLYVVVVIGGFCGNLYFILKLHNNLNYMLIAIIGLYIAFIFPFGLKLDEYRYFVPGYPFFLISCIYSNLNFLGFIFKKK